MPDNNFSRGGLFGALASKPWAPGAIAAGLVVIALLFIFTARSARSPGATPPPPDAAASASGLGHAASASLDDVRRGKALYSEACVACHGSDLRGGIGFNLVDSEWVHGSAREEILNNIKNGFPEAGMAGFGGLYTDDELSRVVDFILSRREGWEELRYAVWPLPPAHVAPDAGFDFAARTRAAPTKTGTFEPAQADFAISELEDYVISVVGTVHIPDAPAAVWIEAGGVAKIEVRVDDEVITPVIDMAGASYLAPAGRRELTITYATAGSPDWFSKDLVVLVANPETGARLFPLSEAGRRLLDKTSFEVRAETGPRVFRRRVQNLPPSTISVGLPSGINYGFNSRTCAIAGVWSGGFLDIGPNIDGRGQAPAFPLGDWAFHAPREIAFGSGEDGARLCRYDRTSLSADAPPVFHFSIDGTPYRLTGRPTDDGVEFIYETDEDAPRRPLSAPDMDGFVARVEDEGSTVRVFLERTEAQR